MTNEERRQYDKAWREKNKEKVAAKDKRWREANRERYNAYQREYKRKKRLENYFQATGEIPTPKPSDPEITQA